MISLHKEGIELLSSHVHEGDIVIVAPLNWGLGHATRCIPLIRYLQSYNATVIIASDGLSLKLLTKEFPELMALELPSYNISYKYHNMLINILLQGPSILINYIKELKYANKIVAETHANIIISDNRFGFRTPTTSNFYITHQVNILHPIHFISWISTSIHRYFINKFDQCWIPDYSGEKALSGKLSESNLLKDSAHLGPLTRIEFKKTIVKWDICILLSGPEPQRTIFEDAIIALLPSWNDLNILMIRGTENLNPNNKKITKNCTVRNLLDSSEISEALNASSLLISRPGYTTIMDIHHLEIKAIFIPTPGQTEQEYLAKTLAKNPKYMQISQDNLSTIIESVYMFLK